MLLCMYKHMYMYNVPLVVCKVVSAFLAPQQIFRESKQWENILNLVPKQVAEDLTRVVRSVCVCVYVCVCTLQLHMILLPSLPCIPPPLPLPSPLSLSQDSEIFCSIDSSEYIADLWRNPDHLSKENLEKFEGVSPHIHVHIM